MDSRTRASQVLTVILFSLFVASSCYAGGTTTVSVSAVVLSKGSCHFATKTTSLAFGSLDPGNPVDHALNTTLIFRCQANGNNLITFSITDDSGQNETGPNEPRMKNSAQEYLPYTLTLNPTSGSVPKAKDQTLTVTGIVKGVDYQNALTGDYSDTVTISIQP